MGTGVEPTNDSAFKFVFGTEERIDVLALLLNAVITDSGGVPMQHVELANPSSVKENADDRVGILDVRARDDSGGEWLIEMQMLAHASLAERLVWNTAKHFSQQLEEGKPYAALRPVIMVCFLNDILFDDDSGQYHWCFKLLDQDSGRELTGQFVIHIVELPKLNKTLDELASELDRWTYFLTHGAQLDLDHLPPSLQSVGITKAVKGLVMFSQDNQRWHEYLMRRIWEMDQRAFADEARQRELRGERKGEIKGRTEGRTEGELTGTLNTLVRIGTRKFGAPRPEILTQLNAFESVTELEAITDRVLEMSSWDELLACRS